MTTAAVLIQDALREGNVIPIGKDPTTAEQTESLAALNRYYLSVFGYGFGEQLTDWLFPSPQRTAGVAANFPQQPRIASASNLDSNVVPYPPINSRIVWGRTTGTIYFPESPGNGSRMAFLQGSGAAVSGQDGNVLTIDANGRTIEGNPTLTLTSPAAVKAWVYRADLGDWKAVAALAPTDEMPFPESVDDYWICWLAARLAPRYGKTIAPETTARLKIMEGTVRALFQQSQDTVYRSGEVPNSYQSYSDGAGNVSGYGGW